jgi:hypothetical protein
LTIHTIATLTDVENIPAMLASLQPEPNQGAGVGIRSIDEIRPIRSYAGTQIEWIIPGVLPVATVNLWTGESGSGKSTVTTDIARCVSEGKPFAGLETKRMPVLIMDRENPHPIVVERMDRLGADDSQMFRYWGNWCDSEAPLPSSPLIKAWIGQSEPKPLIIIDSFIAFFEGDENSATEVRAFFNGLRGLVAMGATIIVLHHSGKGENTKEYRGSSDFKGSVDVGYVLTNLGDSSRLSTLRLKAFKQRLAVMPEMILHYHEGGGFEMDSRGPSVPISEIMRQLLVENPGVTAAEFERLTTEKGMAVKRARGFLSSGIESGAIRQEKGSRNAKLHTWTGND